MYKSSRLHQKIYIISIFFCPKAVGKICVSKVDIVYSRESWQAFRWPWKSEVGVARTTALSPPGCEKIKIASKGRIENQKRFASGIRIQHCLFLLYSQSSKLEIIKDGFYAAGH